MLSLQVRGLKNLFGTLGIMSDWARKPFSKTAALKIRESFNQHAGQQFDSKGNHMGTRWRSLNPQYRAWKASRYPGKPLMIRTTKLVKSLADKNSPHAIFRHEGRKMTIGSRVPYAIYHQEGRGKLPKRPLFVVTKKISTEWAEILAADLEAKIK